MGCFCHQAMSAVEQWVAKAGAAGPAPPPGGGHPGGPTAGSPAIPPTFVAGTGMRGENVAQGVAQWLAARDLPVAKPWTPEPAWQQTPLPQTRMGPREVATISALAHLRAQAQSQFGVDLLHPAQAHAFSRIVATMNARLAALASRPAMSNFSAQPWTRLASLNEAVDRVTAALHAGTLNPTPAQLVALTHPGGQPMAQWAPLVSRLRQLAPLIAASRQLQTSPTDPSQLAAAVKTLSQVSVPPPPAAAQQIMANLTAAMSAQARLQASLGVNPSQAGYGAAAAAVRAKLNTALRMLAEQTGVRLQGAQPEAVEHMVLSRLPAIPPQPGSLASAEAVKAAQGSGALAALTWKVPHSLPATANGLTACSFVAAVQEALGTQAVQAHPCGSSCDAARLMAAA